MDSNNSTDGCYGADAVFIYKAYAVLNIVMGTTACGFGIFVLTTLFLFDKHLFYNQRLMIYLNSSVIMGGLASITSVNPFLSAGQPERSTYCTINGFVYNWSILTQLAIIWWITLDVFRLSISNKLLRPGLKLEVFLILLVFFLPPLLLWIPAIPQIGLYGPDGPLCDIQTLNYTTCKRVYPGYYVLGVYRVLPFLLSFIVLPALLAISTYKLRKELKKSFGPQQQEIVAAKRTVWQFQVYPFLYFLFSIAPIAHFLTVGHTGIDPLVLLMYFFYIVGNNIRGIALSFVFVFHKDTRVFFRNIKTVKAIRGFLRPKRSGTVVSYHNEPSLYMSYGDSLDAREFLAKKKQNDLSENLIQND